MIHYVYDKQPGQASDAAPVIDVPACWRDVLAHVERWSPSSAGWLRAQASIEVDAPRKTLTLLVTPALHQAMSRLEVRVGLVGEAIAEVFGPAYRWAVVPGTWAQSPGRSEAQAGPLANVPSGPAPGGLTSPREASRFESLKQVASDGAEFWSSRELAEVLGYRRRRDFERVLAKARTACRNSGHAVTDHFAEAFPATPGVGMDTLLSRYACYLVIQNSDPQKTSVAQGQSYFAVQARRQEISDQAVNQEDQRRLMLRREMATHNKKLAAAARKAGVVAPEDFSAFQNEGYKGLYGGMSARMIRAHRQLADNDNILDTMGSTELAANLFRATQTEEKIRRDDLRDKDEAIRAHHRVGARVRQAMREISGVMPEELPVVEHIKQVRRRVQDVQAREDLKAL